MFKRDKKGWIVVPTFQSGSAFVLYQSDLEYNGVHAIQHESPITYRVISITNDLLLLFIIIRVWGQREYHTC